MKRYLAVAAALLMWRCTAEPDDIPSRDRTITSVTASLGNHGSRIAVTVTPQLDAYTWKDGDRLTLFGIDGGAFDGSSTVLELTAGAGTRVADFAVMDGYDGLTPGREYMAVHPGSLTPLTPPEAGGSITIAMPRTIDMFSVRHEDVEDNLVLWALASIDGTGSPHIDFAQQFNDHTSILEFEVKTKEDAGPAAGHRILSLRATTTTGPHFVTAITVGADGCYTVKERHSSLSVNLLNTPELSTAPITVRMPVWWDQDVTSSVFSFGITTADGLTFTAADRPKNSPISAGRTVRPIPIEVDGLQQPAAGWDGTETTQPEIYDQSGKTAVITSAAELAWLAEQVNGSPAQSFAGWTITLGADIHLSGHDWTPIGAVNTRRPFSGTFDGNGYAIYGLHISSSGTYNALFGYCRNATVRNLTIGGGSVSGGDNSAAVCAYAYDTGISGCRNRADVHGSSYVGGIAGNFFRSTGGTARISRCTNSGTVSGTKYAGSIAGSISSPDCIESCSDRSGKTDAR